ncbi:MAG: protoporphyrinogen oxidase, partial [Planctomycetes bacterium]|nr:protoporphyrinogen oxidase [Planctomycetota bacterium]
SARVEVDAAVLGGGISGLAAGFLLRRAGLSAVVLEATSRPGGSITTWRGDGFLFELGPNTVLNNSPEIDELCEKAELIERRIDAAPASKKRFIVKRGELVPLPGGAVGFLRTPLFSARAKLRLLREPFIGRAPAGREESIAEFTRRRLGQEFLDYAVGPFVSGVYAGDPARLSVRHATAKIHALEERYGSLIRGAIAKRKGPAPAGGLFTFPGGLDELPRRLAETLGSGWRPGVRVASVTREGGGFVVAAESPSGGENLRARSVISALPAAAAAGALRPLGEEFAAGMLELPQADVALVCIGYPRDRVRHPLDGFGFLAPEREGRFVLGCLFPSALFPGRAPEGHAALTAFVGGAIHPERVEPDAGRIIEKTLADLTPLLGLQGDPTLARAEVWKPAIPQYVVGHGRHKEAARRLEEEHPGLFIAGNVLYGISVGDCIRSATAVARRVAEFLRVR